MLWTRADDGTEASAFRMAAATVVGQTIAILSAIVVVVVTIKPGYGTVAVLTMTVIAVAVTVMAFDSIAGAGDLLLSRLQLVRETNLLN